MAIQTSRGGMVTYHDSPDLGGSRDLTKFEARTTEPAKPAGPPVRLGRIGPAIMVSDGLAMLSGFVACFALGVAPALSIEVVGILVLGAVAGLFVVAGGGTYRSRVHLAALDDLPGIGGRMLIAGALAELLARLVGVGGGFVVVFAIASLFLLVGRLICYSMIHWARRRGVARHRTLIVGAGAVGSALAAEIHQHRRYGLDPVAFYDPHPLTTENLSGSATPVIKSGDVAEAIASTRATVVLVAFLSVREASLVSVIRQCDRMKTEILCVPRLFELSSDHGADMDRIGSVPLLRLRRGANRSGAYVAKRGFDFLLALLAITLLSPLLAALALGVLVANGRPILFSQERRGKDSVPFRILKFRSLPNAASNVTDSDWNNLDRQPNWFGKFLRASSLDELPQLFNILRGDMSIVGPRPERPAFADQFSDSYRGYSDRHRVPVGLTGLAQVEGLRGDTSIARRAEFDNAYVESWSLWSDVKIILRTFRSVIRGEGK